MSDEEDCAGCRYPKNECPTSDACKRLEHNKPAPTRPDWDKYFLGIAIAVSARADCTRRQVGAVIVDINRRIVGTGYNGGAPRGPSCLKGECPRGKMSLEEVAPGSSYDTGAGSCIALHAEQNALNFSDYSERLGGTIYITCEPCEGCGRQLAGSGLSRAVWLHEHGIPVYRDLVPVRHARITNY